MSKMKIFTLVTCTIGFFGSLLCMSLLYEDKCDKCEAYRIVHARQQYICDSLYHVVDSLKGNK